MNDFQNEWAILHCDIEKYERFSQVIKLVSILISVLFMQFHFDARFATVVILILWLQDGIWKTFQKRLETRILIIEKKLLNTAQDVGVAFQFYSQWQDKRQGIVGLLKEYLLNSTKPTVAYFYVILIILMIIF